AARQMLPADANASGGHCALAPVHDSGASQAPLAARHTSIFFVRKRSSAAWRWPLVTCFHRQKRCAPWSTGKKCHSISPTGIEPLVTVVSYQASESFENWSVA